MSPTTRETTTRLRPWMIAVPVIAVVLVLAAFNVKVVSTEEADAGAAGGFDAATFAEEEYPGIAGAVEADAIDLADLLQQLADGAEESELGHTSGASSAFAFPVTFTATAGEATPPVMPVSVEGVPDDVTVQVQVGPAVNGTALRDVTGEISFNEFTNQLEYQNVGTELNNRARAEVLDDFDAAAAEGKQIVVTGAFLRVNPSLVSVVPVKIEVLG
ncbi:DUF2291 family protein [Homoserinibacter sp. YIM 151385]|uniref:DUF2291 family protein n=1 Tax=Homoserinibacter sp. YIM 151385 TaxID=2985506 RepID=UPI0022F1035B|nr:DUF2291 family protein [Homoserinibacter sp. YIM 151385]WBU37920.1 DUF2291 family protein [Homoserinibacter sp. YIM 151385]